MERNDGQRRKASSSTVARKRESDKLAQRASRERTRHRLAYLEAKVELLEATDRPKQITGLLTQIEELREENTRLQALILKVQTLTQDFNISATGRRTILSELG